MNTSDLKLFIRIAETGSITESAKQSGMTTAAASYALKRLEQQSGIPLFLRTTRQLRITDQGEKFLFHCRQALDALELGLSSAREQAGEIAGELRFSVSSDLGRNIVSHWVDDMLEQHPALSIDLNVSDSLSDFFQDHVDLALRYGKPEDSTMVSFHIATMARITCASPEYLDKHGIPDHPEDLRQHNCLLYRLNGRLFNDWQFHQGSTTYKVKVRGSRATNDTDIVRRWAVAGKGIAYRSQIDISSDLKRGHLIPLLQDYESPPAELYLLCPGRRQVTPAVIAFRDMLRARCKTMLADLVAGSANKN